MRFDGIQALRFFAALLVVGTHSTLYAHDRLDSSVAVWNAGTIGVDIFFIISGFVMVLSSQRLIGRRGGWREFLGRRLIRIVPMYWLATTLKVVALLAIPTAVLHADLAVGRVVASYFFLPSYNPEGRAEPLLGVGWTLIFEIFFYVLFASALAAKRNVMKVCVPVLIGCALLQLARPDEPWPLWAYWFNAVVLYFAIGMFLGRYVITREIRGPALGVLGCVGLYIAITGLDNEFSVGGVVRPLVAVVAVVAAIEIPRRLGVTPPRVFERLGDASYSLYLFHPIFAPVVPMALAASGIIEPWLSVALTLVLMPAMALVVYALAERPSLNLLRRFVPRAGAEVPTSDPVGSGARS